MWTTKTVRVEAAFTTNCYFLAFKKKIKTGKTKLQMPLNPKLTAQNLIIDLFKERCFIH